MEDLDFLCNISEDDFRINIISGKSPCKECPYSSLNQELNGGGIVLKYRCEKLNYHN